VAGDTDLTIVVVEHPSLAHLLKIAFNAVWDQGLTLEEAERLAVAANAHQAASR
jgi:hypothetical protein